MALLKGRFNACEMPILHGLWKGGLLECPWPSFFIVFSGEWGQNPLAVSHSGRRSSRVFGARHISTACTDSAVLFDTGYDLVSLTFGEPTVW